LADLKASQPDLNIEIVGINLAGDEGSIGQITEITTFPWLQDTVQQNVQTRWQCLKDDLVILNSFNTRMTVFNLGLHDLQSPINREALKQMFLQTAAAVDSDGDHLPDDWEQMYFGDLAAKPGEDADHDGRDNFTEFAFGTYPKNPSSSAPFRLGITTTEGRKLESISFLRRAGSILDYFIETSPDLVQWTPINSAVAELSSPRNLFDGTGTSLVQVTLKETTNNWPHDFVRVRAVPRRIVN
jgi:hypothetical protein